VLIPYGLMANKKAINPSAPHLLSVYEKLKLTCSLTFAVSLTRTPHHPHCRQGGGCPCP